MQAGCVIEPAATLSELPAILVGVSGEYFVAVELCRSGYVASITLRNTRGIDTLAANADASAASCLAMAEARLRPSPLVTHSG